MFDLSFFEMIVIAVVALIVIGPEKLPVVARTMGKLVGRFQSYLSQVKEEVSREARFGELQALQGEIAAGVNKVKTDFQSELTAVDRAVKVSKDHKLTAQANKLKRTARSVPIKKSMTRNRKRQALEKVKSAT